MTPETTLVAGAVAAVARLLTEAGKKAAAALGQEAAKEVAALWAWVKAKVAPGTAAALEQAPDDPKARGKLEGALEQVLEAEPALEDELRRLVDAARPQAERLAQAVQHQVVTGNHNIAIQITGQGNRSAVDKL